MIDPDKVVARYQLAKGRASPFQVGNDDRLTAGILLFEQRYKRSSCFGVLNHCRHAYVGNAFTQLMHKRGVATVALPRYHKNYRPDKCCERLRCKVSTQHKELV